MEEDPARGLDQLANLLNVQEEWKQLRPRFLEQIGAIIPLNQDIDDIDLDTYDGDI